MQNPNPPPGKRPRSQKGPPRSRPSAPERPKGDTKALPINFSCLLNTDKHFNLFLLDQLVEVMIGKPNDSLNMTEFPAAKNIHGWIREPSRKKISRARSIPLAALDDNYIEVHEKVEHTNWLLFSTRVNSLVVKLNLDFWASQNDLNLWQYLLNMDVEQIYLFD